MELLARLLGGPLALFVLASCAVAPPPDPKPPGPEVRQMIIRRATAVIVTGGSNLDQWVKRGYSMRDAPDDADGGSATPITNDGYFLTADHVLARLAGRKVYVLYSVGAGFSPVPARVVWRSEPADLALLHVPLRTPHFYQWTNPDGWVPAGSPVVHGGIATALRSEAGRVTTTLPPDSSVFWHRRFKIDIPLQPGDSGGPVLDANGRLVGINSAVEFLVPMETAFFVESEGSRPDPRMIDGLIREDRKRNTSAASGVN
ncbi:MAG: trypsin-like peptidase domain-containing protein [Akkermansiaceae bacterium]|nr:trypsin-like peptidase domain-containing protein [Akkermansiaceae bacterium]MCP5542548.1 trypsin-like peptidase domain-containing protein [Akkermansiaceae bacterium]MCP5547912.1 trypsin-like peptidase domain-containing protein [Akkermansiaceae bacterium]